MEENRSGTRWLKTCTLQGGEWERLDAIMEELHCANISFFARMVINKYIQIIKNNNEESVIEKSENIKRSFVLTKNDAILFVNIMTDFNCKNINQFFKKLAHGQLRAIQISEYPDKTTKSINGYIQSRYRYATNINLSYSDGEAFNKAILDADCENASQLARKIARGELILIKHDLLDSILKRVNVKLEDEIANLEDEIDT